MLGTAIRYHCRCSSFMPVYARFFPGYQYHIAMTPTPIVDENLIRRYDQIGPRYTSYPTAVQFHERFNHTRYAQWLKASNENLIPPPLSLYIHIPFCDTVCYYCACNKIITRNHQRAQPYLEHLYQEMAAQAALIDTDRQVKQLHLGGGTPTFLSADQLAELMTRLRHYFNFAEQGDYSIEVDPRRIKPDLMAHLRQLGFNRISLGVQDFDPAVQQAVNRLQSVEETVAIIHAARQAGFHSLNIDLIYGLPRQSWASFAQTLDKIIAIAPDRLSLFNYAHLPHLFKTQKQINSAELPAASEKLTILKGAIEHLTQAGYQYIGMDHFAKADDELVLAQKNGSLYRNFQGYSTHADCDLIGLGATAISKVGDTYSQNHRTLDAYYAAVKAHSLAVFRGIELSFDDLVRQAIIMQLMCYFYVDTQAIATEFRLDFEHYFANILPRLAILQQDRLIEWENNRITVTPQGRLLIRNIAMVFDRYHTSANSPQPQFSRVI